jgi:hypothetical protein
MSVAQDVYYTLIASLVNVDENGRVTYFDLLSCICLLEVLKKATDIIMKTARTWAVM